MGWNKGLTKETDPRVARNAASIKVSLRRFHSTQINHCKVCGAEIRMSPSYLTWGSRSGIYCSLACRSKDPVWKNKIRQAHRGRRHPWQEGANNWHWKGGYEHKFRDSRWLALRKTVVFLNNHTCQLCQQTEKDLGYSFHVHHINYNKQDDALENLTLLCRKCHTRTNSDRNDWYNFFKGNTTQPFSIMNKFCVGVYVDKDYMIDNLLTAMQTRFNY